MQKRLIFGTWLGPGCASEDWYITVLKIQTKILEDGRQVQMESFKSTMSLWSLSHKPTIKPTIQSISPVPFSRIFLWKIFYDLLSKYLWQSLFLVKSHAFSIFFWATMDECVCIMKIFFEKHRKLLDIKNKGGKCYLGYKEQKVIN